MSLNCFAGKCANAIYLLTSTDAQGTPNKLYQTYINVKLYFITTRAIFQDAKVTYFIFVISGGGFVLIVQKTYFGQNMRPVIVFVGSMANYHRF